MSPSRRQLHQRVRDVRERVRSRPFRMPWFGRSRRGVPRRLQRFRLLRDVVGAVVLVALTLGGLMTLSGGTWPPIVVIESGSMMHPASEVPYGRIGTIDVGDIVFVRASRDPLRDIHTWAEGGDEQYGRPGDVIVYAQNGDRANVSIIHRAMTYVKVEQHPDGRVSYTVDWVDGQVLTFGSEGIYLPELGFHETWGFTRANGYRPTYSGFITKGDNPGSNAVADQAAGISRIVDPTWIYGTVEGELPWMGLAKLALQTDQTNPEVRAWLRIGNAFAPVELWTMFFAVVGLLILVPLAWDTGKLVREHRRRRREQLESERELRRREARSRGDGRGGAAVEFEVL